MVKEVGKLGVATLALCFFFYLALQLVGILRENQGRQTEAIEVQTEAIKEMVETYTGKRL